MIHRQAPAVGATPAKLTFCRRNGCCSVTPAARIAPGWILPVRNVNEPREVIEIEARSAQDRSSLVTEEIAG